MADKYTTPQQKTDDDGYAVLKTTDHTVYSTIDQHRDGNAHPTPRDDAGPFFNRNTETTLTPAA